MRGQQAALQQGAGTLGLALTGVQVDQLLDYLELLQKWGKVYNLTAVRDPAEMLTHHLLDSLAVIAPLRRHLAQIPKTTGVRLLDVGSGAGLPGVVVAVCCPELAVSCVDTVGKKVAFVQQVAVGLKLPNLRGIHARVENLTEHYDVVVARAFASLVDFTRLSMGALAPDGVWMAMKGKPTEDEMAALPAEIRLFHVEPLHIPGLDAQRCLVWMRRQAAV